MDRIAATYAALLALLDERPELYPLIVWPLMTAALSFAQERIKGHAPRVWLFLQHFGLDLAGALRLVWPRKAPKLPPPGGAVGLLLLCIVAGAAVGCAGQPIEQLQHYAEAARDVAAAAEPCLVAQQEAATRACDGDVVCVGKVKQLFAPIADALDLIHETWCKLSPKSEGCS